MIVGSVHGVVIVMSLMDSCETGTPCRTMMREKIEDIKPNKAIKHGLIFLYQCTNGIKP